VPETLTITLQLGEPVEHRGIAVAPLFPLSDPVCPYLTMEDALPLGFRVTERDAAGSVPELLVANPTGHRVLLYDGEELAGAKQDRILNVSVLVAERSETVVPVSCVEAGRWSARGEAFDPAPHTGHPALRRSKAEALAERPLEPYAAQSASWAAVRAKEERVGRHSPTSAHADLFRARAASLSELEAAFPLQPGQCGAALAFGGRAVCLDALSRPGAFARLYPRLLRGYLMDGLDEADGARSGADALPGFLAALEAAPATRGPSPGLGRDVRLAGAGLIGSALEVDGETVQVCAFAGEAPGAGDPGRIARPSRRGMRPR